MTNTNGVLESIVFGLRDVWATLTMEFGLVVEEDGFPLLEEDLEPTCAMDDPPAGHYSKIANGSQ